MYNRAVPLHSRETRDHAIASRQVLYTCCMKWIRPGSTCTKLAILKYDDDSTCLLYPEYYSLDQYIISRNRLLRYYQCAAKDGIGTVLIYERFYVIDSRSITLRPLTYSSANTGVGDVIYFVRCIYA